MSCNYYYDPIPNNTIQISYPLTNAEVKAGNILRIQWDYRDVSEYLRIDIYNEGVFVSNIDTMAKNNYEYRWNPPKSLNHSEHYQLKITDYFDPSLFTLSDEFMIYKTIKFPDKNLNQLVLNSFGNPIEITTKDLVSLETLDADNLGISNITGIENCFNLEELNLSKNKISDITPIANLILLTKLDLNSNQINSIYEIRNLKNLEQLILSYNYIMDFNAIKNLNKINDLQLAANNISNINFLTGLTNLQTLHLNENAIYDIQALEALSSLEFINFLNNSISNINILASLSNLNILIFTANQIEDIYPLVQNTEIGEKDILVLTDNPLNDISKETYIPDLEGRGVTVIY